MIELMLFVLYSILLLAVIYYLPFFRKSKLSFGLQAVLFSIKIAASVILVLIYTYYYSNRFYADVYKFFDDGVAIHHAFHTHPIAYLKIVSGIGMDRSDEIIRQVLQQTHHFDKENNSFLESSNALIIRLNAVFCIISRSCVYIHALFFSFLAYCGSIGLYRAFQNFFTNRLKWLMLPLFYVPSVLFWTSGMLKETLLLFLLGLLVLTATRLLEAGSLLVNGLISLVCLLFLWQMKPFMVIAFLIAFYTMFTIHLKKRAALTAFGIGVAGLLTFFLIRNTVFCDISTKILTKRNEFIALGKKMNAGSLTDTLELPVNCSNILKLVPVAFENTCIKPLPFAGGMLERLFGVENVLILGYAFLTLVYFKRPDKKTMQLLAFCLVFLILNYALIGFTVPILGAIVRYKVIALIFGLIACGALIQMPKKSA